MKRVILLTILFCTNVLFFSNANGQQVKQILDAIKPEKAFDGTPIVKKGSSILQVGVGMGSNVLSLAGLGDLGSLIGSSGTSNSNSKVGPISIGYEYLIKDNVGLGISVSYAEGTQTLNVNSASSLLSSIPGVGSIPGIGSLLGTSGGTSFNSKVKSTTILLSTIYHLYTTDKLDPYSKVSIGATLWSGSSTNADGSNAGSAPTFPTPIAYEALIGLRYFVGKQMGLYGELSYSNLKFAANIGLTFKLH